MHIDGAKVMLPYKQDQTVNSTTTIALNKLKLADIDLLTTSQGFAKYLVFSTTTKNDNLFDTIKIASVMKSD